MQSYPVAGKDRVRRFFSIEQDPYELSLSSLKDLGFNSAALSIFLDCLIFALSIHCLYKLMKTNFPSFSIAAMCMQLAIQPSQSQEVVTLKDINITPVQGSNVDDFMLSTGSKIFITSDDDIVGSELWSIQTAASFNAPQSVAIDSAGNVFVADSENHTIRKITPTGSVSVFAGSPGIAGSNNGIGMNARFSSPKGIAILQNSTGSDPNGTLYVADTGNHVIRKITPTGVVMTLSGSAGVSGSANGARDLARFSSPEGVAVVSNGFVYVADTGNHTIRQITPTGTADTYAGAAGQIGNTNATSSNARFNSPRGIVLDTSTNVFVADTGNHTIRRIDSLRVVTTFAGSAGVSGSTEGNGTSARFSSPRSLTRDTAGSVYVADSGNHTIRKITSTGTVTTLAGSAGQSGNINATGSAARFDTPSGVAVTSIGEIYIADRNNHLIRKCNSTSGVVTKYAGTDGESGSLDGSAISTSPSSKPQLVKDINPGRPDAEPKELTVGTNSLFFSAVDSTGQRDLWKLDFSTNVTSRLGNNQDYNSNSGPENLIFVNGTLYFSGATFVNGRELWKSNGTTAETIEVLNINTSSSESSQIRDMFNFNNKLVFVADDAGTRIDPAVGAEIWTSNGTAAGTTLLSDVLPGSGSSTRVDALPYFTKFNNLLYFAAEGQANLAATGRELFRTTGSSNGHTLVKDISIGEGGSSPTDLVVSGADFNSSSPGVLYFVAGTDTEGRELWKSDGTIDPEGTTLVKNIRPGGDSSDIQNIIPLISNSDSALTPDLAFGVIFTANDGASGNELWYSDGTSDGTIRVKDITSGENGTIFRHFISLNPGIVLFTVEDPISGEISLWRSNGTDAGTYEIEDFIVEADASKQTSSAKNLRYPVLLGSNVYFMLGDDEVWTSNGIDDQGTILIHRFRSGTESSDPDRFATVLTDKVVFAAMSPGEGVEPWITDGTPEGTRLLSDIAVGAANSNPSDFTAADANRFFFTATNSSFGQELYVADASGASLLKNIRESGSSGASHLFWHTNTNSLFFAAAAGVNNAELWKSDGTEAGTLLLKDLNGGSLNNPESVGSNPAGFVAIGGTVYFTATNFFTGRELYKTDGTAANTTIVKDISAAGQNSANPEELVVMPATGSSSRLYFVANGSGGLNGSQDTGRELWQSDGTAAGTVVVRDIIPGSASSITDKAYLTVVGSTAYFVAEDQTNGRELWRTSGTASSTRMVKNINTNSIGFGLNEGSNPTDLINVNGKLFFLADDGVNGIELWVSDGSSSGTVRVSNLVAGTGDGGISSLASVGDVLCFSADNGTFGREVWFSDGSLAGTKVLVDFAPGSGSSNPQNLFNYQGNLLYSASDNNLGGEPRFVFMRPSIIVEHPVNNQLVSGSTEIDFSSDAALAFGGSKTLPFTIRNAGINNLRNISTQLSGLHAADFSVATKSATTIAGNTSSTLAIKFTPKEGGLRQALLTIRSSDLSTPAFEIEIKGVCAKDPTVTLQPVHQLVKVGAPITLTTGSTGTLPMSLQWRRNSKAVTGATLNPLYLWAAKITDAGSYTAQFKNGVSPGGTGTSDIAEIGVVQDFEPSRVINVKLNGNVSMSITAAGNGLSYLWKRSSGVPLSGDTRFSGFTTQTLTLKTAQLTDAMNYFCEVTGPGGMTTGGTTTLNVIKSAPALVPDQDIAIGVVGSVFRHVIKVVANTEAAATSFSSSRLPSGLKLDSKTGVISGVPTTPGSFSVTLNASNGFTPAPTPLTVTIVIVAMPTGLDGTYSGLVSRELEINGLAGGRSDITVAKSGAYTGSVVLAGTKYSFKGNLRFAVDAGQAIPPYNAEVSILRKGISAPLTLRFEIDSDDKNRFSSGSLTSVNVEGDVSSSVTGWKVTTTPSHYSGRYHLGIRIPTGNPNLDLPNSAFVPQGNGYATFTVGSKGTLSIAGRTADGEKITCATFVGPEGEVLLYQSLYTTTSKGSLQGQLRIDAGAEAEVANDNMIESPDATFDWVRPANPTALSTKTVTRTYKAGFGLESPVGEPVALEAFGGFYAAPAVLLNIGSPSPTVANASLTFTGAGIDLARLEPDLPNIAITSASAITRLTTATAGTTLKASRTTGAISGSFTLFDDDTLTATARDTEIKRVVPFQGLIVPESGVHKGVGYFMLPQIPPTATATKTSHILSGKMSFLAD